MKKSIFDDVLNIAKRSLSKHRDYGHFMHFSFVVQSNKIVEWGTNNKRVPAKHNGYHGRIQDLEYSPKTHSEVDAWKKAKGLLNKKKTFVMVNVRLNRSGQLRNSCPCSCCYEILKAMGCSRFYFSSKIGFERK